MAKPEFQTTLREFRELRGWSQEELARRSELSRAGVSAIETGRLIPSTAAALALASALGCRVEDVFRLQVAGAPEGSWAWAPESEPCRYWQADIGAGRRRYPVEPTDSGMVGHDGVFQGGVFRGSAEDKSRQTLVMAGCDPAVGLLAAELARVANVRLIALTRSSRAALSLLGQGLVHVAGIHLARADQPGGNAAIAREALGPGYKLLRVARWDEGITFARAIRLTTIESAVRSKVLWVGREAGSGARQCLDELLGDRKPPLRLARDHRGVAEAVRGGWAEAGVCLRLVSEEAGLDFLPVRQEDYDLCFAEHMEGDHRIQAILQILCSTTFRASLGELPGYDSRETGALQQVS